MQRGGPCLKNLSMALDELSCKFITSPRMWRRSGLMINGQLCDWKNLISLINFRYSFRVFPQQYFFLREAASGLYSVRPTEAIPKEVPDLGAETRVESFISIP